MAGWGLKTYLLSERSCLSGTGTKRVGVKGKAEGQAEGKVKREEEAQAFRAMTRLIDPVVEPEPRLRLQDRMTLAVRGGMSWSGTGTEGMVAPPNKLSASRSDTIDIRPAPRREIMSDVSHLTPSEPIDILWLYPTIVEYLEYPMYCSVITSLTW
jgi:hypothetical protein